VTIFVGLTGGVAAGKSAAMAIFEQQGAAVFSTDLAAHRALDLPEVRDALLERWGEGVVVDGELDRNRIAGIVFKDAAELEWLEGLLHPKVRDEVARWRAELDPSVELAVIEVPLLFESGLEETFDATVSIVAEDETRSARMDERGHEGNEGRESRQLGQDEKARRSTYVISNDGSLDDLAVAITDLSANLRGAMGGVE
jgi:dephospho-CoA kinase